MLNLGRLEHLAAALGIEAEQLRAVLDDFDENPDSLFKELTVWPADPSKKPRDVISLRKPWRSIQERIHLKLLLPLLVPTKYSHGGVRGRSPATNARAHIGNTFAFVTDISGFYPAIKCWRINRVFLDHACSYHVARILTRFCSYDFHLALGLMTSPILANEIFKPIDLMIARACRKIDLTYTRFVDDITISGRFDLSESNIASVVKKIVTRYGFSLSDNKTRFGRLDRDICITGARVTDDHINPSIRFMHELGRLIDDHVSLANNGPFQGPLLVESELFGKAHHACFLNPGLRRSILSKLRGIAWDAVMNNAVERGWCRYRDKITGRGESRPSYEEELPLAAGRKAAQELGDKNAVDPSVAPWEEVESFY